MILLMILIIRLYYTVYYSISHYVILYYVHHNILYTTWYLLNYSTLCYIIVCRIISYHVIVYYIRSVSEISWCFCWAETLAHWNPTSCQKISAINSLGFETLKLKIRRLNLWKTDYKAPPPAAWPGGKPAPSAPSAPWSSNI